MHAPLYRSCRHSGHVTDSRQEQRTIDWCKAAPNTRACTSLWTGISSHCATPCHTAGALLSRWS